jgi:hypothetical protein
MHNARCACGAPPLLHVPGGGGCVSGAGSSTQCGVPRTLSASCDSLRCAPLSVNAYNEEEVRWFEVTYDYLEVQLDDAELAKRMLPAMKQRRGGRSATSAPAAPAVPSPVAAAGTRTTPRAACATQRTTTCLFSRHPVPGREGAKQGRRFDVPKQRLYILCIFCIFVIFCISDILCIFDIFYIFLIFCICCC